MLDTDVKNGQSPTRRSQILLPIATLRPAASPTVLLNLFATSTRFTAARALLEPARDRASEAKS